jgi:hypothetical protein
MEAATNMDEVIDYKTRKEAAAVSGQPLLVTFANVCKN